MYPSGFFLMRVPSVVTVAGLVFNDVAYDDAASIIPTVTSEAEHAHAIVTSEGGNAITLGGNGLVVVTTFAKSVYTEAIGASGSVAIGGPSLYIYSQSDANEPRGRRGYTIGTL